MESITFKKIMPGYYYCIQYDNYTIKKKNNVWIGYDKHQETGNHICYFGDTLKEVENAIRNYITNGVWYAIKI